MKVSKYVTIGLVVVAAVVATGLLLIPRGDRRPATPRPTLSLVGLPSATVGDEELLTWAETVLAGRCMVARGYPFAVAAPAPPAAGAVDPMTQFYGTTDVAAARKHGYGISPHLHVSEATVADPNLAYTRSLSAKQNQAYSLAYFGDPNDTVRVEDDGGVVQVGRTGCLADARSELYGGIAAWAPLDVWATALDSQVYARVIASPAYQAPLAAWRACMAGKGVPVESPGASRERIAALPSNDAAERAEVSAAVAEADCNRTSRLTATAIVLHRKEAARLLAIDKAKRADYRSRRAGALVKARELAAGQPSAGSPNPSPERTP